MGYFNLLLLTKVLNFEGKVESSNGRYSVGNTT